MTKLCASFHSPHIPNVGKLIPDSRRNVSSSDDSEEEILQSSDSNDRWVD